MLYYYMRSNINDEDIKIVYYFYHHGDPRFEQKILKLLHDGNYEEFMKCYAKEIKTGRLPQEARNRETSGYGDITKKENFLKIDFAECEWG